MIKTKDMKRKIPVFRVTMNSTEQYDQIKEVPGIQRVVIEEVVFAIKDGINNKKKSISLFEIADTDCLIELKKENWKPSLEKAMSYYSDLEEYNRCIEVRDIISKL
jgi:delta-aminolevulinic acid dehydratase/porphobilinogen synthase